jgi:hypothetical protein
VASDGTLIDPRRVELLEATMPKFPHHHEALALRVALSVALVERVARSAQREAKSALEALASSVASPIAGVALRACPPLPATVAERLADYRAQNVTRARRTSELRPCAEPRGIHGRLAWG